MTSPVVTAGPSAPLEEIADLMLDHRIGCVVIVDPEDPKRVIGIVTEDDFDVSETPIPFTFFRWPKLFGQFVWSEGSLEQLYLARRRQPVEEIMSAPVLTVDEDAEVWEAVSLMVKDDVKRLPVLRDDRLVGLVARHDLLKCLHERWGPATRPGSN